MHRSAIVVKALGRSDYRPYDPNLRSLLGVPASGGGGADIPTPPSESPPPDVPDDPLHPDRTRYVGRSRRLSVRSLPRSPTLYVQPRPRCPIGMHSRFRW